MRVKLAVLMFVLVTGLVTVGCGPGIPAGTGPTDSAATSSTALTAVGPAWDEYRHSLLAWADDVATDSSSAAESDDENHPDDADDSYYRREVEQQQERLSSLEQLKPPPEIASLHQRLLSAFRDFVEADEVYRATQAAKNYLAGIRAGIMAQEELSKVNSALLELVQALEQSEG